MRCMLFFFFNDTATTEIYTLSLHDALPICMSGELVVGGSTIPGEYVLPALIGRFKGKYPDISICLLIGSSRQVTEWVEAGRVEGGVVGAPPGPKAPVARGLIGDELVVIVPARHAWAGRQSVTLPHVKQEPLIV